MSLESACSWLQDLSLPTQIRESPWLFPTLETVHVFALVFVVGSIMTVDLRLLGLGSKERPFTEVAAETLPWTWSAFVLAAAAGSLLFSSKAVTYYGNIPFRLKMACLVLAALNMAAFQLLGTRRVAAWDRGKPPLAAKLAGAASLMLWLAIVGGRTLDWLYHMSFRQVIRFSHVASCRAAHRIMLGWRLNDIGRHGWCGVFRPSMERRGRRADRRGRAGGR